MSQRLQDLRLRQTEALLEPWMPLAGSPRPQGGWVAAIRTALGMSATALAKRARMTPAGLMKLEKAEAGDAASLATLKKLAAALDCELCYALVPKLPLAQVLQARALTVAAERLGQVAHSMALEDQAVEGKPKELQLQLLAQELLEGSRRELWR